MEQRMFRVTQDVWGSQDGQGRVHATQYGIGAVRCWGCIAPHAEQGPCSMVRGQCGAGSVQCGAGAGQGGIPPARRHSRLRNALTWLMSSRSSLLELSTRALVWFALSSAASARSRASSAFPLASAT